MDGKLIPKVKQYARRNHCSLSSLIETSLRQLTSASTESFSARWTGRLEIQRKKDPRFDRLAEKYL
jgi:hypothetical protein